MQWMGYLADCRQLKRKFLTWNVQMRKIPTMRYRNMERQKDGKYEWLSPLYF